MTIRLNARQLDALHFLRGLNGSGCRLDALADRGDGGAVLADFDGFEYMLRVDGTIARRSGELFEELPK